MQTGENLWRHIIDGAAVPAPLGTLARAIADFESHRLATDWEDGDEDGENLWSDRWKELVTIMELSKPTSLADALAGLAYLERKLNDPMDNDASWHGPILSHCLAFMRQAHNQ